jgi:hypothetical protein
LLAKQANLQAGHALTMKRGSESDPNRPPIRQHSGSIWLASGKATLPPASSSGGGFFGPQQTNDGLIAKAVPQAVETLFRCPRCGGKVKLARVIPKFRALPRLAVFQCVDCRETITVEGEKP